MKKLKYFLPIIFLAVVAIAVALNLKSEKNDESVYNDIYGDMKYQKYTDAWGDFIMTDKFIMSADNYYEITDKNSGVREPYCFKADCQHGRNNKECLAVNYIQRPICFVDSKIYGFSTEMVNATEEQMLVYRSDIDRENLEVYDKIRINEDNIPLIQMVGVYEDCIYLFVTYENDGQRKSNTTERLRTTVGLMKYDVNNKKYEFVQKFDAGYSASAFVTAEDENGIYFYLSYCSTPDYDETGDDFVFKDYYYNFKENTYTECAERVVYLDNQVTITLYHKNNESIYKWYDADKNLTNEYKLDNTSNTWYVGPEFIQKMVIDEENSKVYSLMYSPDGELLFGGKKQTFFIIAEDEDGYLITHINGMDCNSTQGYITKKAFREALEKGSVEDLQKDEIIVREV